MSSKRIDADAGEGAMAGASSALMADSKPAKTERKPPKGSAGAAAAQIVVLGMHRSGTSALTGCLSRMGVFVGDEAELTGRSWQNLDGFYERRDAREICDALLHGSNADWWKVSGFDPDNANRAAVRAQRTAIQDLVEALDAQGPAWALKEPRLSVLFPIVRSALVNPLALITVRHPLEVARSLRRRNGFTIEAGLALWEAYTVAALRHGVSVDHLLVRYDDLVADPEATMGRVAAALEARGVPDLDPAAAATGVRTALRRERADEEMRDSRLTAAQSALWESLKAGIPDPLPTLSEDGLQALREFETDETERQRTQEEVASLHGRINALKEQMTEQAEAASAWKAEAEAMLKRKSTLLDDAKTVLKERDKAVWQLRTQRDELKRALEHGKAEHDARAAELAAERDRLTGALARAEAERDTLAAIAEGLRGELDGVMASRPWRLLRLARNLLRDPRWLLRRRRLARRAALVRDAALFDPAWYREASLFRVPRAQDPAWHYVAEGAAAGLSPHPLFDPAWYARQRPDAARSGLTPLEHYLQVGAGEGASPHPLFDPAWYARRNPDVAESGADPLDHFLAGGGREGRAPHLLFDSAWYLETYPDVARGGGDPLVHFVASGAAEGRAPHPLFDAAWYAARYADVRDSGMNPLVHFITAGAGELRDPHPAFKSAWYFDRYPDAAESGLSPLEHYLTVGFGEGKSPHPHFDEAWYRGRYPEADRAGVPGLVHFLRSGCRQGYKPNADYAGETTDPLRALGVARAPAPGAGTAATHGAPAAAKSKKKRIIVYSCVFGGYENVKIPAHVDPEARYILFTDREIPDLEVWEQVVLNEALSTPRRTSRLPKMLPHRYLPDHDVSIYLDGSLRLMEGDIGRMAELCLKDKDIGLYPHHRRACVYDEIDLCERLKIETPEVCSFYRNYYRDIGYVEQDGLFENTLIVRRNTDVTRRVNEAWWELYRGERDQLSLMAALARTGAVVHPIDEGRQVRHNPFVKFSQHNRRPIKKEAPRLYVFTAFAPAEYGQDLGRTYNEYMEMIGENDYALFLDHDAMFCGTAWHDLVSRILQGREAEDFLVIGRTNRIGKPYQRVTLLEDDHRIADHARMAGALRERERDWLVDVTRMTSSSGLVMLLGKKTWRKSPFAPGFLKVDNRQHLAVREIGGKVWMPRALYAYHFYRADGDASHAVRLPPPPEGGEAAGGEAHAVRNFVFDDRLGLTVGRYMALLQDGQHGLFVRNQAMMCEKYWYARACRIAEEAGPDALVLFNANTAAAGAPEGDDVLAHRAFAAELAERHGETLEDAAAPEAADATGFMISRELYARLSGDRPIETAAGLMRAAAAAGVRVVRAPGLYVFAADAVSQSAPEVGAAEIGGFLDRARRVAILTLGFWPNQAGMEMMIHNLAQQLTAMGDTVTLFTPRPEGEFEEIEHRYILRRYKSEADLTRMFEDEHLSMPFDAILVQGAYEAASLALALRERFDVPVVLRTHGEDIQIDRETGYGYRLHPEKGPVIEANIRAVDQNVVIGGHIVDEVRQIAPESPVSVIHNGVDTERFHPHATDYLRETLGLSADTQILLTVGRNVKKKSLHLAVEALAEIVKTRPDTALVHAGKEGNGEDLRAAAERLGVGDKFFQIGPVNYFAMPEVYASADLFIFPSKTETFGNVTVEAMASGLPCVEFDYVVNRDKVSHGEDGYIAPYGDVSALARFALDLLGDDDKRAAFGAQARQSALEKFAWPAVAGQYRAAFDRAAEGRVNALPRRAIGGVR